MNSLRIAVLMGGDSSEREISLRSGQAVAAALRQRGHQAHEVILDDPLSVLAQPEVRESDVVFVALHGGAGEDGRVQALLELARRPYVGSAPGPCAVAMDKIWTKHICRSIGVPTPAWAEVRSGAPANELLEAAPALGWPVVLKPVAEGSTVGVSICADAAQLEAAYAEALRRPGGWMLERYIAGRELTLPVLMDVAMSEVEMRPKAGFYDYTNKYTPGRTEYDCPAAITPAQRTALRAHGLALFRALRMRDLARIDFRMDERGDLHCLEANAIPGMTAQSLFPMGARAQGIEFPVVCERLAAAAWARGQAGRVS